MKQIVLALAFLAIGCEQEIPKPIGHVNDFAEVLPKDMAERLEAKLKAYKTETTNEVAIVTVKSLGGESVEDYTVRLAKAWGVGNKKKDNGVVFLIAPSERKCRIEVGYGLEAKLTDIQAKQIIEGIIIPEFKAKRMPEGIEKGTESIVTVLSGKPLPVAAKAAEEKTPVAPVVVAIILGILIIIVVLAVLSEATGGLGGGWSSSGGFSSGGGGGSSGGFGGGSFGGGGASGSW